MLTNEKVLQFFGDYLAEDKTVEVALTSRGYLLIDWEADSVWASARICPTPEALRDALLVNYASYLEVLVPHKGRDLTEQEEQAVEAQRLAMLERCNEEAGA